MASGLQGWNYFELLGLDELNPPRIKVDQQWRQLRAFYQSEAFIRQSGFSPVEIKRLIMALDEAYRVISHPELRQKYVQKYAHELEHWALQKRRWQKPELPMFYELDESMEAWIQAETDWNGTHLKKVREYKNVSIERLAFYTKIRPIYLQAIEDMDFARLPSLVFVKGYVKEYARALRLDAEKVVASYVTYYERWRQQAGTNSRNLPPVAVWRG